MSHFLKNLVDFINICADPPNFSPDDMEYFHPNSVHVNLNLCSSQQNYGLVSFLVVVYFARVVGASHFGVYTFIISLVYLVSPLCSLGMRMEVLRRSKSRTLKFFEGFLFTFGFLDLLASLVVGAAVLCGGYSPFLALLAVAVSFAINFFPVSENLHLVWGRSDLFWLSRCSTSSCSPFL